MAQRNVNKVIKARPATDGAGVKINRLSGFSSSLSMDPFMMLDEIRSDSRDDFVAGFPPHPHRGFETITYMLAGGFSHEDSMGNKGAIGAGGAQWMTAGSGVIHSEMPLTDANYIHGFQFWLNLPAAEKMNPPAYRDIQADEVVSLQRDYARVQLIAGDIRIDSKDFSGTVTGKTTQALIADIDLAVGGQVSLQINKELSVQFYVYRGSITAGEQVVRDGHLAYLSSGVDLALSSITDCGLLLFGGKPLKEPLAHHGPFVMNTEEQIRQAISDYQNGVLVQSPSNGV